MKRIEIDTIVLFVLLIVLNLQANDVFISQNTEPATDRTEASSKIYALANQVSNLQLGGGEEDSVERFNITLWITDWKGYIAFGNMKVTIYDLKRKRASSYLSNETGHVNLKFIQAGPYVISVRKEDRTVGHQKISVTENETFTIRTWAYDLNITFVDEKGDPLANHTVLLHDQMDQTMFHVGTGNGTRTKFHLGRPHIVEGTDRVYLNGVLAANYTLDCVTGELTFDSPPENMTEITADYSHWVLTTDDVRRVAFYAVIADEAGPLVTQAETDENGTVHFAGVWNGTYRVKILGKESWIEEYILGEPVLTLRKPAAGECVIDLQKPSSITLKCVRLDLKLQFISESNVPIRNAAIQIRNMLGHLFFKDHTNHTGFIDQKNVYAIDRVYAVSARCENRVVGYKVINVREAEIFTVKCWTKNLTITCIDRDRKPLPGCIVLLYDQLVFHSPTDITVVTDQTGILVNHAKTDEDGIAYFNDVWNGTYWIMVMGGEVVGEETINLQEPESITIRCNKTSVALRFVTSSREPLPRASIVVFDNAGDVVFRDRTDENGYVFREGMYLGTYIVHAEWMGTQVWSGTVDVHKKTDETIRCIAYRLTIRCVDPFGNRLPKADVTLRKRATSFTYAEFLHLETDETGCISVLLPYGFYEASCSYGVYSGEIFVTLDGDRVETVSCNVKTNLLISMFVVAFPLVVFSLVLERRRLRAPSQIKRYKNMLSKLESMYKNGLVEYKIYRKLREEYEAKIMELGGREMR